MYGFYRYRKGNDDEIDMEEKEIRMTFNSRQNLSRDIRDRMQISMEKIKEIQLDLEMIQNGSGIISLKDLHQQNVVPQYYYSWFSGNEEQKEIVSDCNSELCSSSKVSLFFLSIHFI